VNAPDDAVVELAIPAHIESNGMPCFACWLEAMLGAAGDVYDDHGQDAYEAAVIGSLGQVATCLGAVLAALGSVQMPPQLLRDQFLGQLDGSILLNSADEGVAH
jgi:hypothetical protein